MKDIAIYGAGGLGREIACLIQLINVKTNSKDDRFNIIGFFDDGMPKGMHITHFGDILGGIKELNEWNSPLAVVIGIGNPESIKYVVDHVKNDNIHFPNIISDDIRFLDEASVSMGQGNIICSKCIISCDVKIGNFNILNGMITIGHDAIIGEYNVLMPNVRISGCVTIGDENLLGMNSAVVQNVKIGNKTTIGACSLIFRKTKDGHTYIGNPASILI